MWKVDPPDVLSEQPSSAACVSNISNATQKGQL